MRGSPDYNDDVLVPIHVYIGICPRPHKYYHINIL